MQEQGKTRRRKEQWSGAVVDWPCPMPCSGRGQVEAEELGQRSKTEPGKGKWRRGCFNFCLCFSPSKSTLIENKSAFHKQSCCGFFFSKTVTGRWSPSLYLNPRIFSNCFLPTALWGSGKRAANWLVAMAVPPQGLTEGHTAILCSKAKNKTQPFCFPVQWILLFTCSLTSPWIQLQKDNPIHTDLHRKHQPGTDRVQ